MSEILNVLEQVFTVGPQIMAAATAVTMATKTNSSNEWINIVLKVINFFAGNCFNNKNKDDNN